MDGQKDDRRMDRYFDRWPDGLMVTWDYERMDVWIDI